MINIAGDKKYSALDDTINGADQEISVQLLQLLNKLTTVAMIIIDVK
jgi:hypothetical protein